MFVLVDLVGERGGFGDLLGGVLCDVRDDVLGGRVRLSVRD